MLYIVISVGTSVGGGGGASGSQVYVTKEGENPILPLLDIT